MIGYGLDEVVDNIQRKRQISFEPMGELRIELETVGNPKITLEMFGTTLGVKKGGLFR
jgi:hypothetical protein